MKTSSMLIWYPPQRTSPFALIYIIDKEWHVTSLNFQNKGLLWFVMLLAWHTLPRVGFFSLSLCLVVLLRLVRRLSLSLSLSVGGKEDLFKVACVKLPTKQCTGHTPLKKGVFVTRWESLREWYIPTRDPIAWKVFVGIWSFAWTAWYCTRMPPLCMEPL